jgi:hypothetical protein
MNSREPITSLSPIEVFVFGSNEAGRHGRGAAFTAKKWGARNGKGVGQCGQTYAIPTKDKDLKVLPLRQIQKYISDFILYAQSSPALIFLVTRIGCGLAGYKDVQVAPLFLKAKDVENIHLPESFINIIKELI